MDEKVTAEKQPVAEALRSEILKLAKDGDAKKGGALTEEILQRIMRVAKTGRDLLVSLNASPSNLAGMLKRPRPWGGIPVMGENPEDEGFESVGGGLMTPYAPTGMPENFGMTAIREIISATKNLNGGASPAKLVEALVLAKEKGLDDVARELEGQLGIGKKDVPAEPPKPVANKETAA